MSRKILEESYEIFLSLFSLERDSAPTPTRLEHITQSNISREQLDVLRCIYQVSCSHEKAWLCEARFTPARLTVVGFGWVRVDSLARA